MLISFRKSLCAFACVCFILFTSVAHADLRNGLVGWWKFDEKSGNAIDSSGNNNTGTPSGTTIVSNCKIGGCRLFNGSSDYVNAGNASFQLLNAYSLTAWIKTSSTDKSDYRTIIGKDASSTNRNYWLSLEATSGYLGLRLSVGGVGKVFVSTTDLHDMFWHHVVAVFDGSFVTLYADGIVVLGPTAQTGPTDNPSANSTVLGMANGNVRYFPGLLDDMRIYNRALTAQEVKELYFPGIVLRNGVVRNGRINQ